MPTWGSGACRSPSSRCCRTISRARTRSSSAAAPRMSRRGWRAAARGSSASTTPRRSSRRRGACSSGTGSTFPLLHGNAEAVPLPDASFDFAISEYGACLWADPRRWVPEAARLLRPGGRLVFLVNSFLMALCTPDEDGVAATDRLRRPAFGLYRLEFPGDSGVEFHPSHGDWIRLLRGSRFEIEDLIEVWPPDGRDHPLPVRHARLGAPLALRGSVESPQARSVTDAPPAASGSRD